MSSSTLARSTFLRSISSAWRPYVLPPLIRRTSIHLLRPFTTSNPLLGRRGNNNREPVTPTSDTSLSKDGSSGSRSGDANLPSLDPLNFSVLDAARERLLTELKTGLGKLKPGGLNLDDLEGIKVELKGSDGSSGARGKGREKGKGERVRVGDIAQVVIRGRICVVMVAEKEHLKPLLTALQSSLTYLPAPPTSVQAPNLEIHIPIPPTTGHSRAHAQQAAKQLGDSTMEKWNEARSVEKKRLRALELGRVQGSPRARKDTIVKAEEKLKKIFEEMAGEVKKLVEGARMGLRG